MHGGACAEACASAKSHGDLAWWRKARTNCAVILPPYLALYPPAGEHEQTLFLAIHQDQQAPFDRVFARNCQRPVPALPAAANADYTLSSQPLCSETKPAQFLQTKNAPRLRRLTASRSSRPLSHDLHAACLHLAPPPVLCRPNRTRCVREINKHIPPTTAHFAAHFLHHIPHYRAGELARQGETAEQLTTMLHSLRHRVRAALNDMRNMSEASLVFPDMASALRPCGGYSRLLSVAGEKGLP